MKEKTMGYKVVSNRNGITYRFKSDISLHFLSDQHIGNNACDYEQLEKAIMVIKNDPKAYAVLNGDLLEYIPPNYKISQRGQNLENEDQVLKAVEMLTPIAHKILWITEGNHETRAARIGGIDITKIIAKQLNVPYYQHGGFSKFTIGSSVYIIASAHGHSAAANGDTELEKMRRLYAGADVYVLSHNHQLYAKPVDQLSFDSKEHLKETWFVRTGSFVKLADYARVAMYPVVRTGWISVELKANGSLDCRKHSKY